MPLSRFTLKFARLLTWYRTSFLDCLTRESPSQQLNRRSTATQIPKKALKQRSRPDPLELLPTVNLIAWQLAGGWQLTYPHQTSTVSEFHSLSYSHLACHAIHHQSPHSVIGKLETGMRISPHLTTSATEIRARTPPRCQTTPNGRHVTPIFQHKTTKPQVTPLKKTPNHASAFANSEEAICVWSHLHASTSTLPVFPSRTCCPNQVGTLPHDCRSQGQ